MQHPAKRNVWLLPIVILVLFAMLWLFRPDDPTGPRMPGDADHDPSQTESDCLACHSHQSFSPRSMQHPRRDDCYSCHADAEGRLHRRPDAPTELPGGWPDDPRLNPALQNSRGSGDRAGGQE